MTGLWSVFLGVTLGMGTARADEPACPVISDLTSSLSGALAEAELEKADELAGQAKATALCQSQPLQTMLAAQLFRLSGATSYFNGDMAGAAEAFTLAASISPGEGLEDLYGQQVGSFYAGIRDKLVSEGGATIVLKGAGEAWIDGRVLREGVPRDVAVGPHIVQVREEGGVLEASELTLAAGDEHVLGAAAAPDPQPIAQQVAVRTPVAVGASRSMLMLGGGGVLVATGAAMLALATQNHSNFDEERDPTKLEGLQSKTNTLATLGLVSGAAGLGMVGAATLLSDGGLGVVFRGRW